MVSKLDNALFFQQQALSLRANRQEVLAANIANADTPNYKARDFDFSVALKDAVAGRSSGNLPLANTAAQHLQGGINSGPARMMYRKEQQSSVDGNTVEMDVERAQFSENALRYEASVTFISHEIKLLMSATQA
ncbi:MAG: flagellar basal body rod protein FlgB [Rhodocyclaceae bacterium]